MSSLLSSLLALDTPALLGVAGFLVYVINYLALSVCLVSSESVWYFVFNILAASLVLYSLSADFNLASVLIQVFWIGIGLAAVGMRLVRQRSLRRATTRHRWGRMRGATPLPERREGTAEGSLPSVGFQTSRRPLRVH